VDQPPVAAKGSDVAGARGRAVPPGVARSDGARRDAGSPADLLVGAGLEGVAVTPELARAFGQIFRVVVEGVMDVLQARQRLKDEFRMGVTTFRHADNNPLKFSANVDDALHNLLVKRNAAYLGPVDAFEDAFDDLRHHQMAMLAGMRAAFEAMVAEFEPDRLQETFDRQLKKSGGFLSVPAKMRYWEMYRSRFEDISKDPDMNFRDLFGKVFSKAYEEQLARLKGERQKSEGNARRR
jgi:type VI secretion system FHA domain protein